ncbi:anti-sigma factor [Thalassospira sp. NFXS8]|uniref:anti-sigma factor family protein n=1 Tax=Thalassospira sp. NFXS8 TaxID=2819093 RepID=UPI0032DEB4C3
MSNRPITEDDLHAYVDLALDAVRRDEVERYLACHKDVAARVAGYQKDRDLLRNAFASVAEEPVPSRLSVDSMMVAQRHVSPSRVWQLAAVAMVMLVVGAAAGWSVRGQWGLSDASVVMATNSASGIAALASEAADSYEVYAPDRFRPVEMRADDSADFVSWASQRLSHPVRVPDLAPAGYRFMGGRIIPTAQGPAAMLMYDDDKGGRMVMLTRPMKLDQNAPMTSSHRGALGGYSWADKGLGYSVVAPLGDGLLHPLADEIRRQLGRDT